MFVCKNATAVSGKAERSISSTCSMWSYKGACGASENLRSVHINAQAQQCRWWFYDVLDQEGVRCQRDNPKCIRHVSVVVVLQILGDLEHLRDAAMHNHIKHSILGINNGHSDRLLEDATHPT